MKLLAHISDDKTRTQTIEEPINQSLSSTNFRLIFCVF